MITCAWSSTFVPFCGMHNSLSTILNKKKNNETPSHPIRGLRENIVRRTLPLPPSQALRSLPFRPPALQHPCSSIHSLPVSSAPTLHHGRSLLLGKKQGEKKVLPSGLSNSCWETKKPLGEAVHRCMSPLLRWGLPLFSRLGFNSKVFQQVNVHWANFAPG